MSAATSRRCQVVIGPANPLAEPCKEQIVDRTTKSEYTLDEDVTACEQETGTVLKMAAILRRSVSTFAQA